MGLYEDFTDIKKSVDKLNEGGGECQATCIKCGKTFFTNKMTDKYCNDCLPPKVKEETKK